MRIALIGDLQYGDDRRDEIAQEMARVREFSPDLAVSMGDAAGSSIGRLEGLRETREMMEILSCPFYAILGNHDVEYSKGYRDDFDPIANYREIFGCDPWNFRVVNGVLLIFVTVERQPLEGMRTVHAVYVTDGQFSWLEDVLRAHPDMPTAIFTHAPAAGCGLRCSPPLHCSSVDKYMDQTYDALRWRELPRRFPQIKLWFSAHYHMGHDYDSAITEIDGVYHVSCGVFSPCSRDGEYHTRFLEFDGPENVRILTFDHLGEARLKEDAVIDLTGKKPAVGRFVRAEEGEMLLGYDDVKNVWRYEKRNRYYILTKKGHLWEYQSELAEFNGTVVLDEGALDFRLDGDRLYIRTNNDAIFSVGVDDPDRLAKIGAFTPPNRREETEMRGEALPEVHYTVRDTKEGRYVRFK